MDIVTTVLITAGVSSVVSILVKVIWDWVTNKNGKKEIEELKAEIKGQRKEFAELKNVILTAYVKKEEFEKHLSKFEVVRDKTLMNENNINMLRETVRQNVQRMSQLEN